MQGSLVPRVNLHANIMQGALFTGMFLCGCDETERKTPTQTRAGGGRAAPGGLIGDAPRTHPCCPTISVS
jgi:hypothetical protein